MRVMQTQFFGVATVALAFCLLAFSGVCQITHARDAKAPATGNILGQLRAANHAYTTPLTIELLPANGVGRAHSTQSNSAGVFAFHSVRLGSYYLIVHTQPAVKRVISVNRSVTQVIMDVTSQTSSTSHKMLSSKPVYPLPRHTLSFSIAGAHGTTAPSGYSAGASEESDSQSVHHLAHMTANTQFYAGIEVPSCAQVQSLLRKRAEPPQDFQVNLKLGVFYLAHAEYSKGIPYLISAHHLKPSDLSGNRDLALAYLAANRSGDAVSLLSKATSQDPSDPSLHLLAAEAFRNEGNLKMARSEFLLAAQSAKSAQDFFTAGAGLIEIGDSRDASLSFQRGIAIHPNSARLFMGLGIANNLLHQGGKAHKCFMHAVDLKPDYSPPYQFLARMADGSEDSYRQIMRRITAFVVTHPENADGHYDYALALWEHSREDISAERLNEIAQELYLAIRLNPKRSDFHFLLGVVNSERHHFRQSVLSFKKCLALDPSNAEAHYRLSLVYRQLGQAKSAQKEIQKFLKLRNGQGLNPSEQHALKSAVAAISISPGAVAPCPNP
jgi:Flp pilus assembly protein TadD